MSDESIRWLAFVGALVGTGALLAGTLVGWRRHPAHFLIFAGAVLSFLGMGVMIGMQLMEEMGGGYDTFRVVRTGSILCFFAGWLCCGPAFLWEQLLRKGEAAREHLDAELQRTLAERLQPNQEAAGERHD